MAETQNMITSKSRKPWTETRNGRIVAAVGVLGLFVTVFWLATKSRGMLAAMRTPLVIDEHYLSFGEVWETQRFDWDIVFQNQSDKPVILRDVRGECECTRTQGGEDQILSPNGRITVRCNIDLTRLRTYDPAPVRPVRVGIVGKVGYENGQLAMHSWTLLGAVRRFLSWEPHDVGLGEELTRGEVGRTLKFRIHPNTPIRQLRLQRTPEGWIAEMREVSSREGSYVVQATPCKHRLGYFKDFLELEGATAEGRVIPTQRIKLEGYVTDNIEVLPQVKDVGVMTVGTIAKASVWVSAKKGEPFEVTTVTPTDRLTKAIISRQERNKWRIDLERTIDSLGAGMGQGVIHVQFPHSSESREITYELRWYGTKKP